MDRHHTDVFRIHPRLSSPGAVLAVDGELDAATGPVLESAVQHALTGAPSSITLDLGSLRFCDCSGLNALLRLRHRIEDRNALPFRLVACSPQLLRLLEITGCTAVLRTLPRVAAPGR